MLRSIVHFDEIWRDKSFKHEALAQFIRAIEWATGFEFVASARDIPFDEPHLLNLFELAGTLKQRGVIQDLQRSARPLPDEPPLFAWQATFAKNDVAGGSSPTSDYRALIATLAESLERHLWRLDNTYFLKPIVSSERAMRYSCVPISRFVSFTDGQRAEHPDLHITANSEFLWIRGRSLVTRNTVHIPAQTVSGSRSSVPQGKEPLIRPRITTGLATGQTQGDALLGGALEVIERDAFMIMWLNQLSLPRINLAPLAAANDDIATLMRNADRYRLSIEVVRLITDAPAHVVCAIVRDTIHHEVPVTIGLGADTHCVDAAVHAITEAIRIRINIRKFWLKRYDPSKIVAKDIHHHEHMLYWLHDKRHERLNFLTQGPLEDAPEALWESDEPAAHLERIVRWCEEKRYECVSVDLGRSKKNPTALKVEMVVIPELQPLHLVEKYPSIGGQRLHEIPPMFGYTSRTPFTEEPHPFV